MKRNRGIALAAVGAVAALVLAACGGSSGGNNNNNNNSNAAFNAGDHRGGQRVQRTRAGRSSFDNSSAPDSTDPGNTYYAYDVELHAAVRHPPDDLQGLPGQRAACSSSPPSPPAPASSPTTG